MTAPKLIPIVALSFIITTATFGYGASAFGPGNEPDPLQFVCGGGYQGDPIIYINNANMDADPAEMDAFVHGMVERIHLLPTNATGIMSNDTMKTATRGDCLSTADGRCTWMTTGPSPPPWPYTERSAANAVCERFAKYLNSAIGMAGGPVNQLYCLNGGGDIYSKDGDGCDHATKVLNSLGLVKYSCADDHCIPSATGTSLIDCERACLPPADLYVCDQGTCRLAVPPEHGVPQNECALLCQKPAIQ